MFSDINCDELEKCIKREELPEEDPLAGLGENYNYVIPKCEFLTPDEAYRIKNETVKEEICDDTPGLVNCNETARIKNETLEELLGL